MKYNGKTIALKFDNLATFNLAVAGVNAADLLVSDKSDAERFCRAWGSMLGVKYDGDQRAFMAGFGDRLDVYALNAEVIAALERDGVIPTAENADAKKKKNKRR